MEDQRKSISFNPAVLRKILITFGELWLLVIAVMITLTVYDSLTTRNENIRIIPQQPIGQASPYICFAALQGDHKMVGLDCIDVSLTDVSSGGFQNPRLGIGGGVGC